MKKNDRDRTVTGSTRGLARGVMTDVRGGIEITRGGSESGKDGMTEIVDVVIKPQHNETLLRDRGGSARRAARRGRGARRG